MHNKGLIHGNCGCHTYILWHSRIKSSYRTLAVRNFKSTVGSYWTKYSYFFINIPYASTFKEFWGVVVPKILAKNLFLLRNLHRFQSFSDKISVLSAGKYSVWLLNVWLLMVEV